MRFDGGPERAFWIMSLAVKGGERERSLERARDRAHLGRPEENSMGRLIKFPGDWGQLGG